MCFTPNNIFFPCGFNYDFTCAQQYLDTLSCLQLLLHRSISKHHIVLANLWSYCFRVLFPMWRNLRFVLHFMYLLLRSHKLYYKLLKVKLQDSILLSCRYPSVIVECVFKNFHFVKKHNIWVNANKITHF
jgi:hypothetical protein